MQRAVETGLNRWYPSAPDPFMAGIEADPRYRAIVSEVRAGRDLERQRVGREGG